MATVKKKSPPPAHFQSKKAAAAEDARTPGKHNPYSVAEARKEAMWQHITKNRKHK